MPRQPDHNANAEEGYTLLEVMVVLAILATVTGLTWPALMKPWSKTAGQQAAQELAEELLNTRMRAIEESRVYEFRWKPGTGEYEIKAPHQGRQLDVPNDSLRSNQAAIDSTTSNAGGEVEIGLSPRTRRNAASHVHKHLLNDVKFSSPLLLASIFHDDQEIGDPSQGDASTNQPVTTASEALPEEAKKQMRDLQLRPGEMPRADKIHWSGGIWFYPDGSCSNSAWQLVTSDRLQIEIRLRGLTGTVRVERPRPLTDPRDVEAQAEFR